MPAVVIRNISLETHRALQRRAREKGMSTEAEIRAILDHAVGMHRPFVSAWDVFSRGSREAAEMEFELPERERYLPTVKFD